MHFHSLFFQKRTISICCACILLAALIVGVLPFLSFPAMAEYIAGENGVVNLSDCFVSSQQDSDSLDKVYRIADNDPGGGNNLYFSFIDGYKFTSYGAHNTSLSDLPGAFYVGDVITDALSFSVSYDFRFVTTGAVSNPPSLDFYIGFLDGNGDFISYKKLAYYAGSKYPNTRTFTGSVDFDVPANAEYFRFVVSYGAVNGFSSIASSCTIDIVASYEPLVLPIDPVVTSNFASSYSYLVGQMPSELSVGASITDNGTLSYQWYINTTNSTSGGTAIDGATAASFSPPPSAEGTYYYYCAVTNTLGNSTATTYSDVTQLTFTKPVAARPTVNSNYDSYYSYYTGDTAAALSVGVTVTDGGTVTYQWYQNTVDGTDGATSISGATSSSYTPPTIAAGTMYYYCVVTNTLGDSTSVVYSKHAEIEVIPSTYILQAGQYECKSSVMTGEYVSLDAWPDSLTSVNLAFRSSGVAYSQLSYKYDLLTGKGYGIYFDDTMAYTYGSIDQTAGFLSDAYALIYLEADQEVPTAFYEWFMSCFTYVGADEEIPVYSTIVQIYDNSGMVLLTTYTISGNGIAPFSYGSVLVNGVQFVSSSGEAWTWSGAGDPFYGFSLSANSVSTWYMVGETFTIGGVAADNTLTLYVVDSDTSSIDQEYQDASLNWFERIWQLIVEFHDEAKAFYQRATSVNWEKFTSSVEQKVTGFLDIIDFSAIGDFFKDAYHGISTLFGLSDLLYGENSPFGWLLEE